MDLQLSQYFRAKSNILLMFEFQIASKTDRARTGIFTTPHGDLLTPGFARQVQGWRRARPQVVVQDWLGSLW
ncbi:MAG: hypothetical protein HY258_07435 [Chloroflexi bacterium]|nr:hypothetical protein [Chloroflexota bacterium]